MACYVSGETLNLTHLQKVVLAYSARKFAPPASCECILTMLVSFCMRPMSDYKDCSVILITYVS